MSSFDAQAREWDNDKMHMERSVVIAAEIEKSIPLKQTMKVLEFGAGTGILSFLLKDRFSEITLMDNSVGMINVCNEKIKHHQANHIKPVLFDLEHHNYTEKYDIIYNQMVMHHVNHIEIILNKFYSLLNPEGYLAIADLYTEDGSFHIPGVNVHRGFDPNMLSEILENAGFKTCFFKPCFEIKRELGKIFPVFLLIAQK